MADDKMRDGDPLGVPTNDIDVPWVKRRRHWVEVNSFGRKGLCRSAAAAVFAAVFFSHLPAASIYDSARWHCETAACPGGSSFFGCLPAGDFQPPLRAKVPKLLHIAERLIGSLLPRR